MESVREDKPIGRDAKEAELNSKFQGLSEAVRRLVNSPREMKVSSFEALLTQEISSSLHSELEPPRFSVDLIRAARGLLASLVVDFEEGKVRPRLRGSPHTHTPEAAHASTSSLAYSHRYMKDLLSTMLQNMSSHVPGEEEECQDARSTESKQRIRAIREEVRADAGLEPQTYCQLQQELTELKRSLSLKQEEGKRAVRELERIIAEQQRRADAGKTKECCGENNSANDKYFFDSKSLHCSPEIKNAESKSVQYLEDGTNNLDGLDQKDCIDTITNVQSTIQPNGLEERNVTTDYDEGINQKLIRNIDRVKRQHLLYEIHNINTILRLIVSHFENPEEQLDLKNVIESISNFDTREFTSSTEDECEECSDLSIESGSKESISGVNTNSSRDSSIMNISQNKFKIGGFETMDKFVINDSHNSSDQNLILNLTPTKRQQLLHETHQINSVLRLIVNKFEHPENDLKMEDVLRSELHSDFNDLIRDTDFNSDALNSETINSKSGKSEYLKDNDEDQINMEESLAYLMALKNSKAGIFSDSEPCRIVITQQNGSAQKSPNEKHSIITTNCQTYDINSPPKCGLNNSNGQVRMENNNIEKPCNVMNWYTNNSTMIRNMRKEANFKDHLENIYQLANSKSEHKEFSVEETSKILRNISFKIDKLNNELQEIKTVIKNEDEQEVLHALVTLQSCLSYTSLNDSETRISHVDAKELSVHATSASNQFLFLAGRLAHTPPEVKQSAFSSLAPPESLTKTLAVLASTEHFRDCFISAIVKNSNASFEVANYNSFKDVLFQLSKSPYVNKDVQRTNNLKIKEHHQVVTPHIINKDTHESSPPRTSAPDAKQPKNTSLQFIRDAENPDDLEHNLARYEHYLGLTASLMTVQHVSDMLLYISTVLNDVPARIKSERILALDPPYSLLSALDVLHSMESEDLSELERRESFRSLTVQTASDLLLTISRAIEEMPSRLKASVITDVDPPSPLLRAIALLTSLPHNTALEDSGKEDDSGDSQVSFFDAVSSFTSLRCTDHSVLLNS